MLQRLTIDIETGADGEEFALVGFMRSGVESYAFLEMLQEGLPSGKVLAVRVSDSLDWHFLDAPHLEPEASPVKAERVSASEFIANLQLKREKVRAQRHRNGSLIFYTLS